MKIGLVLPPGAIGAPGHVLSYRELRDYEEYAIGFMRMLIDWCAREIARRALEKSRFGSEAHLSAWPLDTDIINILGEDQKPRWPVAHYLSDGEIRELYADLPGATDNAIALATRCRHHYVGIG